MLFMLWWLKVQSLPIVVYRGLNGTCCSGTTAFLVNQLKSNLSNTTFIHSITLSPDPNRDAFYSSFASAPDQIMQVCHQLQSLPQLSNGYIGVGLSQGGLLMRGVGQMCVRPPMRRLITLGSPQAGISRAPFCGAEEMKVLTEDVLDRVSATRFLPKRLLCRVLRSVLMSMAYTHFAQSFILPAQYFRDPDRLQKYAQVKPFIARLNNEFLPRNQTYINQLSKLDQIVLIRFSKDSLVYPPYSPWFDYRPNVKHFNFSDTRVYEEDWLGLRALYQRQRIHFLTIEGDHLDIPPDYVKTTLLNYLK